MIRVISLGAGVQSSTMALMFARGELAPMVDAAIFADTGAEPTYVYEWLKWLEKQLPFPVYRVADGSLYDDMMGDVGNRTSGTTHVANPPFFVPSRDGRAVSLLLRKCTKSYKVIPIERKMRELVGLQPGQRAPRNKVLATQYIGISFDETIRMKPSRKPWIVHEWPLVEKRMHRLDCLAWMDKHGYPRPQKSACTFCPYHDDATWRDMKANRPADFAQAVRVDELLRTGWLRECGMDEPAAYVHRSMKPLAEIDFASAEDHGQQTLFGDECEGLCGV